MSALPLAAPRPSARPAPRRHLEIAPAPARRTRPKVVPILATIAGLGGILLAQLLLSIVLADGAYTIAGLQSQARDLQRQEQALTEQLEVLSSTQNLTANAEHLGMVASGSPVFLDLGSGAVSGDPTPAGGSLTAGGNQVGNSLLADATLVDPAPAETSTTAPAATPTTPGATSPTASADPGSGTIPSPTTR